MRCLNILGEPQLLLLGSNWPFINFNRKRPNDKCICACVFFNLKVVQTFKFLYVSPFFTFILLISVCSS